MSRVLRRPGSVLAACCGARAGGGYMASARAELRDAVKPAGKRLWASEFGCGTAPLNDMAAGVALSAVILQVIARLVEREMGCLWAMRSDMAADM